MLGKAKMILSKRSPEIWLGAGIVAIVSGTVWACYASRKVDDVLDDLTEKKGYLDYQKELDDADIAEAAEDGITLKPEDLRIVPAEYKKQRAIATLQCAGELAQLYVPAMLLIGGGIVMVVNGHRVLSKRNASLLAAYGALDDAFKSYRKRVVERLGEDMEKDIYLNRKYEELTVTEIDENGKKKKSKEKVLTEQGKEVDLPYIFFYDHENSREWTTSDAFNHTFLIAQQNAANDLLRVRTSAGKLKNKRGWVFMNEVLQMLGFDPTPTGAVCGWVTPLDGEIPEGDDYIDFGIVEGNEDGSIMLNFNCQGMIYDLI